MQRSVEVRYMGREHCPLSSTGVQAIRYKHYRLLPESLWDKYQLRYFHSTYNKQECKDLYIPKCRIEFAKKAFITRLSRNGNTSRNS